MFLAQISSQISSFRDVAGHINSSNPALPLWNITSSFVPPSYAVPVNVLWVLSLTLSLTAAFFAIAVQQWLRQLQIPVNIPLQRAAQLLTLRFEGLQRRQVPAIISLLPLLLQIAVVLFLAGLFILFRALNKPVAIAFGAAASVVLLIFLIMTVAPLFRIRCPYKSPFIPTLLTVLQWICYPITVLAMGVLWTVYAPCNLVYFRTDYNSMRPLKRFFLSYINLPFAWLLQYTKSFGRDMFVGGIGQFWLHRECEDICGFSDEDLSFLDGFSLLNAFILIRSSSLANVMHYLRDTASNWAPVIFIKAVEQGIHNAISVPASAYRFTYSNDTSSFSSLSSYGVVNTTKLPHAKQWLSIRHHRLGWIAITVEQQWNLSFDHRQWVPLHLLHVLSMDIESMRILFASHLLGFCQKIPENAFYSTSSYTGACLLFDSIWRGYLTTHNGMLECVILYSIFLADEACTDAEDLVDFIAHASDLVCCWRSHCEHPFYDATVRTACLALSGSALSIMAQHPTIFTDKGRELISSVADFVASDNQKSLLADLQHYYTYRSDSDSYMVPPLMMQAICGSLAKLADTRADIIFPGSITSNPDMDYASVRLVASLRNICAGVDKEEIVQAMKELDKFDEIKLSRIRMPRSKAVIHCHFQFPMIKFLT